MAETINYTVQEFSNDIKNIFKGVYNDFKNKAFDEYKFELTPLDFEDFVDSVNANLIKCLVLLEDSIPTAFMVYTTEISESLVLNIIHCLGEENNNHKRKLLLSKFLELNSEVIKEKVVTYPMLGAQEDFTEEITNFGFELVGIAVERFYFNNELSIAVFDNYKQPPLTQGYKIVEWNDKYANDAIEVINTAFKNTSDALFDPRFASIDGSKDILDKIIHNIYGKFLPDCSSVLLFNKKPVGICMANITAGRIANIPLVGMGKEHCSKGLGLALLHHTLKRMLSKYKHTLSEINASTETDNYPALKMYRRLGFKEDYYYPQAYKPISKIQEDK